MNLDEKILTEVKMLLLKKAWTQEKLAKEMSTRLKKKKKKKNLGNKLRLETIKYKEIKLIADILGYDLEFIERDKK